MRIKHRYTFDPRKPEMLSFLSRHNIMDEDPFVASDFGIYISSFEIYSDEENFNTVNNFMVSNNRVSLATAEYTKEELNSAKWLTIRSIWNHLHPLPDGRYYDEDNFEYLPKTYDASTIECQKCRKGLKQKWSFIVDKDPKWGARNFFHLKWMPEELFVSKKAEDTLVANGLIGFEFWDVLRKSGKAIDGVKQLKIKGHIAEGLNKDISHSTWVCPLCNTEYFLGPKAGANIFSTKSFEGVQADIIKGKENIGAGGDLPMGLIFVTQKFRKVVTEAKLDKGLIFEPLTLV